MDCEEIKIIIPKYFNHTANEDEIKNVEEHLCVCHDCRSTLGELMDKLAIDEESVKSEEAQPEPVITPSVEKEVPEIQPELAPEPALPVEPREDMEYVPGAADISSEIPAIEPEPEIKETPVVSEEITEIVPEKTEEALASLEPESNQGKPSENIEPVPAETLAEPEKEEILPEPEPEPEPEPKKTPVSEPEEEFVLDDIPLNKSKAGILEYTILAIGIIIFGALLYLLLKG
ncbi:MAG: zf-HC2 domain-containing protein [Candidatus Omnitrophica bacterium]|nr:zf-HC2 domain-containing protein [Candidatus Omnitrophota bacterium]